MKVNRIAMIRAERRILAFRPKAARSVRDLPENEFRR